MSDSRPPELVPTLVAGTADARATIPRRELSARLDREAEIDAAGWAIQGLLDCLHGRDFDHDAPAAYRVGWLARYSFPILARAAE